MPGHKHNSSAATQNQGNTLGDRSCVRQSKLYRMYESGNSVKSILGTSNLCWNTEQKEGAYQGQQIYDHIKAGLSQSDRYDPKYEAHDMKSKINSSLQRSALSNIARSNKLDNDDYRDEDDYSYGRGAQSNFHKQSSVVSKFRSEVDRSRSAMDSLPYPMNNKMNGDSKGGSGGGYGYGETSSSAYGSGSLSKKTHMRNKSLDGRGGDRDNADIYSNSHNNNSNSYAAKMRNKPTDLW